MDGLLPFTHPFWENAKLLIDSRRLLTPAQTVFFAFKGANTDGLRFVEELYAKGVRHFVVDKNARPDPGLFPGACFMHVPSVVAALQQLAAWHRGRFRIPVLAITGSNGKTTVKEWLALMLSPSCAVVKSPKSYNSQVGVPLSIWEMAPGHETAVFEAGISQKGEMEKLAAVIRPDIGLFTNLGPAHDEGFSGREEKLAEKFQLFATCKQLVFNADDPAVAAQPLPPGCRAFTWGTGPGAHLRYSLLPGNTAGQTVLRLSSHEGTAMVSLPFAGQAAVQNFMACAAAMTVLGYSLHDIRERAGLVRNLPMRLELKKGAKGCLVVDDTYNNDFAGLETALDFLGMQGGGKAKTVILSDIMGSGLPGAQAAARIANMLSGAGVGRLVGVGPVLASYKPLAGQVATAFYQTTENFLAALAKGEAVFSDEAVLVKGARPFGFERVAAALEEQVHGTRLEINLEALAHNFRFYRSLLQPGVRLMAMVKAFAYGSGNAETAQLLQYLGADYLAVAYVDEGAQLRQAGIRLPVMVMGADPSAFAKLMAFGLEPEIYGPAQLQSLCGFLAQAPPDNPLPAHIKLDTGMNRLGFGAADLPFLLDTLWACPNLRVASVFTHLAAAGEEEHKAFTNGQVSIFARQAAALEQALGHPVLKHCLNTAGIASLPNAQMDMVRLGIGLYGISGNAAHQALLQPVGSLKTKVVQVRTVGAGESIGYGRAGKALAPMQVATLAIGYADGFLRWFGNGRGRVLINGQSAPVVGNVCMDMCMADITDLEVHEGDEALVFGEGLPVQELAALAGTIPYEIMTLVNSRVKRVYFSA